MATTDVHCMFELVAADWAAAIMRLERAGRNRVGLVAAHRAVIEHVAITSFHGPDGRHRGGAVAADQRLLLGGGDGRYRVHVGVPSGLRRVMAVTSASRMNTTTMA